VLASKSLVSHDVVSVPLLLHLNGVTPREPGPYYSPATANTFNYVFLSQLVESQTGVPWGPGDPAEYTAMEPHHYEDGIAADRALSRAFELSGGMLDSVRVVGDGEPLADDVSLVASLWSGDRIRYLAPG
jgi:hypothetical protein